MTEPTEKDRERAELLADAIDAYRSGSPYITRLIVFDLAAVRQEGRQEGRQRGYTEGSKEERARVREWLIYLGHPDVAGVGWEVGCAVESKLDELRFELEAAEKREATLRDALGRDKTGLAAALGTIVVDIRRWSWLLEGRGPYEWDDDRYRGEAGRCMRKVSRVARDALSASGGLVGAALEAGKGER